ncbi:MAG: hypothetical protein ACKPKO_61450, partial [Candidatus Fonsibacter sp.]
ELPVEAGDDAVVKPTATVGDALHETLYSWFRVHIILRAMLRTPERQSDGPGLDELTKSRITFKVWSIKSTLTSSEPWSAESYDISEALQWTGLSLFMKSVALGGSDNRPGSS